MKPQTIKIDEVEYIRADQIGLVPKEGERLAIVMNNDRGLCLVGWCNPDDESWLLTIRDARCIIYWGDTKGHLAQLAAEGPREKTRFGTAWTQSIPKRNVGLIMDCEESKWR